MAADLRRVLIVDDSTEDRVYLKRLLTKATNWKWDFGEASTGDQGLNLAVSEGPFDCVLLDHRLPDMNGGEFLERLRERLGEPGLPTIVIAGAGDESVAVRALKGGAQDYLSKGKLNAELVAQTVENTISRFQLTLANLQSSRALAESERRYRDLLEAIPQIVWIVTPQGTLDYCNLNWHKFLGITTEEFNRSGWSSLLQEGGKQQFQNAWESGLHSGESFEIEHRLCSGTGFRWYLSRAVPIHNETGQVVKWLGTSTDIEERKKTELAVFNTRKLESIGLLASGIAHDFNNLLVGILSGASYAAEALPASHELQPTFELIISAGESAAHLTRQMLAYAGKGDFFMELVDISKLVQSTCRLIKASIPKHVQLEVNARHDLPGVEADASQMQQIVMNLIINAAEATNGIESGMVAISTDAVDLNAEAIARMELVSGSLVPGQYIVFEVQDNGSGMNDETKAKLFDPFFTTKIAGRGLGLSAAQGILRSLKGALALKTKVGMGSTFRVYLPVSIESYIAPTLKETARRAGAVLVVDDEQTVRQIVKLGLEHNGYPVILAESGEQAIHILMNKASPPIALIVLDMHMPELDGKEVLRKLQGLGIDVPVLICSGYGDAGGREFSSLGIAGFIKKPFTFPQLVSKISSVLSGAAPEKELERLPG